MIEQLLKFFVRVIYAELLERVQLEDFESCHVEDTDEGGALALGPVERPVDAVDKPSEHSFVASLRDCFHCEFDLPRLSERIKNQPSLQRSLDFGK